MTGLDHLEGRFVRPVVDGAVHPIVQVVGGQITLTISGNVNIAGLPYESSFETLPIAVDDKYMTTFGHIKRWAKVYLYLYASAKPLINGQRPSERYPATLMDDTQADLTEVVEVINLGRKQLETVKVVQDLPRRLTVLGLFGELGQDSV